MTKDIFCRKNEQRQIFGKVTWNRIIKQFNSFTARYNATVDRANGYVALINRDAGKEHVAGDYNVDAGAKSINVYEVADAASLVTLLAHELGHALGLYT